MLELAHPRGDPSIPMPDHATHACRIRRVAFGTFEGQALFADPELAGNATAALKSIPPVPSAGLLAWLLMPDAWFGLVDARTDGSLMRCVDRCRTAMAGAVPAAAGPIWAPDLRIEPIHDDVALADAARHLVLEPVRAGLATRRGEYRFWDAVWLRAPCGSRHGGVPPPTRLETGP